MRVLVACEFSGIVRDAFLAAGHFAVSCDLEPTESLGPHHRGDVRAILDQGWDLMIAHPPCDDLSRSGTGSWAAKVADGRQAAALSFVSELMAAPIHRICIENPPGRISTAIRKPDQYIQPYQFGRMESKKTGLWLKNLPLLVPTKVVPSIFNWVHLHGESKDRKKNRSRFFHGIAEAMATQWGSLPIL